MSRTDELWQDMQEAEQSQYEVESCRAEYERDMEPHKRTGYFEMMCGSHRRLRNDERKYA